MIKINKHDGTWIAIKKHIQEKLKQLREENDDIDLSEKDTAGIRANIKLCKEFIDLDKEPDERIEAESYIDG